MKLRILFCVAWLAAAVHAEPLPLVSGPDFAPYVEPGPPVGGIATDIVRSAFEAVNQETVVELRPWARALFESRKGVFVASFPLTRNPERERDYLFSQPILTMRHRIFIKAGNDRFNFKDVDALAGAVYCVPNGRAVNLRLTEQVKSGKVRKESPNNMANCIAMLLAGRVDFFVADEKEGTAQIRESGAADGVVQMVDTPPLTEIPLHLIASKELPGSEALINSFNQGLAAIRKNGKYAKILKQGGK